jgi:hypothetical protein
MRRTLVVAVLTLSLAACGGEAQPGNPQDVAVDVLAEMRGRHQGGGGSRGFENLTELLDNVDFQMGDAPARPLTEAVVVGRVTDIDEGRAFTDEVPGSPDGIETGFDDPDAIWRSIHASIEVEIVVSGAVGGPVVVGFAFDPRVPIEDIREEFVGFGTVLLFLNKSPVFDYDPDVYGTVFDGALLGTIDDEGLIRLPVADDHEETLLLRGASTLEELSKAREEPRRVIHLDESGIREPD